MAGRRPWGGRPRGHNAIAETDEQTRDCLDRPLDELLQRILDDLAAFRGDVLVKDDQCLLALELLNHDPQDACRDVSPVDVESPMA